MLRSIAIVVAILCLPIGEIKSEDASRSLAENLSPWLKSLSGKEERFTIRGLVKPKIDGKEQLIQFEFSRYAQESFDLVLSHSDYAVSILRRSDSTYLVLPKHKVAFMGKGPLDKEDHLGGDGIVSRIFGPGSGVSLYVPMVMNAEPLDLATTLIGLADLKSDGNGQWKSNDDASLAFSNGGKKLAASIDGTFVEVELSEVIAIPDVNASIEGFTIHVLTRAEIEKQLTRGCRRALEILAPSGLLTSPAMKARQTANGELKWIDGQRVVLLQGSPEEIGEAHGTLLKSEAQRCIDSVLYTFGTVQTVVTGRWFRSDLETAFAKLEPFIPERHKRETAALARSLGQDEKLIQTINVFPELFHCSGFAVFGKATKDGKLYHGRVLDYMTTIGLQDAATTFIVAADGAIPFANVGYAGFIGSVSGMNAEKISLGEMGGRGEGRWDGVPMATLMRRALEECSSLEQVKELWRSSPRTCEYYYVFADGEEHSAVGVAATPESVQFVEPGAGHELLGEGIADTVILSAGSRLEELRSRVKKHYGAIDATVGQSLMCRPVAMDSNLHNVLFVPEDGVFYVANADHRDPAADRPYVRLDLHELLRTIKKPALESKDSVSVNDRFPARDTLDIGTEPQQDAAACLAGLSWKPQAFSVHLEDAKSVGSDWLVRFPSACPSGDGQNDLVALEWYQAKDSAGKPIVAPAAVIVHESGSGMTVGRLVAKGLRMHGIHTFMIQLPYYGVRRGPDGKPKGERVIIALRQAISDVRRAHDAVAALPLVDKDRISLQGTSLGGFVTATTAGLDRAYKNVFILLAGGDLYSVLMNGKQDAANLRNDLAKYGVAEDQIKEILSSIEPLRVAHRLDSNRTWLFAGQFDDVVPPRNSDLLAAAAKLDSNHYVKMLANHYSGVIFLPHVLETMREHMIAQ